VFVVAHDDGELVKRQIDVRAHPAMGREVHGCGLVVVVDESDGGDVGTVDGANDIAGDDPLTST
jgi:hypothetical protein